MEARELRSPLGRNRQAADGPFPRSPLQRHLPALPSPLRMPVADTWHAAPPHADTGAQLRPLTSPLARPSGVPASGDSLFAGMRALGARTPRPDTPGVGLGSPRTRALYTPPSVDVARTPSDEDNDVVDSYFSPKLKGSTQSTQRPQDSYPPTRLEASNRYQPSPVGALPTGFQAGSELEELAGGSPNDASGSTTQVNLLATGRGPTYLGPTLNRRSWMPLAILGSMIFCTVPMLFGATYATLGVFEGNKAYQAAGFSVALLGLVGYWAAVATGLRDTLALRPSMSRDMRLRALGTRGANLTLGGLALGGPVVLLGAYFLYAHAYYTRNASAQSLSLIPANVGRTCQVLVCGSLYTIMQMRRGWTPVKINTLTVFCVTAWACTTGTQFGYLDQKNFPRLAHQLSVLVPFYLQIVGISELFARLNYEALQRGLTDNTPIPWEAN